MKRRDAIAAAFLLAASPRLASQGMRRIGVVQGPGGNLAREKWAGRAFLAALAVPHEIAARADEVVR